LIQINIKGFLMLNIFFTADYEMYFGKNYYTDTEILFEPTEKLVETFNKYNLKVNIFADILSVAAHRKYNLSNYADNFELQIKSFVKEGHDVQLHLHPHWLTAKYENNSWIFNKNHFRIHSFKNINEIVKNSIDYLNKTLNTVNPDYKCIAYRAGGWSLQPEGNLLKILYENGIKIDSSIFKGGYKNIQTHYFDFRKIPDNVNYFIDPQKGINIESKNGIFEIPIASIYNFPARLFYKLLFKIYKNKIYKNKIILKKGESIIESNCKSSKFSTVKARVKSFLIDPIFFSFDNTSSAEMIKFVDYLIAKYNTSEDDIYISIIGHPKGLSDEQLHEIDVFLEVVSTLYKDKVNFLTFQRFNRLNSDKLKGFC
jgi:hypothetical protein